MSASGLGVGLDRRPMFSRRRTFRATRTPSVAARNALRLDPGDEVQEILISTRPWSCAMFN